MTEDDRDLTHTPGRRKKSGGFGGGPSEFRWRAGEKDEGHELLEAVSGYLRISGEQAADLIDFGSVHVRGRMERDPSLALSGGEDLFVSYPAYGTERFFEIDSSRVIFRDRFLLAYDKEASIPSQQVPFDAYNNVFAALQRYLSAEKTKERYCALHHRLDMETSGLLLFSLDRKANEPLGRAFSERGVKKQYLAWVEGRPEEDSWTDDSDIGKTGGKYRAVAGGKEARTSFTVLGRGENRSLVLAVPFTGRTHQIRIHLARAGHPVAGDRAYGAKPDSRLYLHAWRLTLKHPVSGKVLSLEAPVPGGWPEAPEVRS